MAANIETLKEIFHDLSSLTPEKLKLFTEEMIRYFLTLREKLTSSDKESREAALKEALELKELLQKELEKLSEASGMQAHEFLSLIQREENNPALEEARKNIESLKGLFAPSEKRDVSRKEKKVKLYG